MRYGLHCCLNLFRMCTAIEMNHPCHFDICLVTIIFKSLLHWPLKWFLLFWLISFLWNQDVSRKKIPGSDGILGEKSGSRSKSKNVSTKSKEKLKGVFSLVQLKNETRKNKGKKCQIRFCRVLLHLLCKTRTVRYHQHPFYSIQCYFRTSYTKKIPVKGLILEIKGKK